MSTSSPFETLTALLPALKTHMPEMGVLISELTGELRMAEKLNVIDSRSSLHPDAENLATQLGVVLEMRSLGVTNDDIEAAEDALKTLALDMRARAAARIREKTSMIRVNAEVSAHRADPDIHAMDITQGYRMMAAIPVSVHDVEDALVVTSIGLPAHGGIPGKIVGDVLAADVPEGGETYFQNSAPTETFYLPAGRTVRLRRGDVVRMYHQGGIADAEINLSIFKDDLSAIDVEAVADEVVLHGPLTFALSKDDLLSDVRAHISAYENTFGAKPIFSHFNEDYYHPIVIGSLFSAALSFFVAQGSSIPVLGIASVGLLSITPVIGFTHWRGNRGFIKRTQGRLKDKMNIIHKRLGSQQEDAVYEEQVEAVLNAKERIMDASVLRMFAARSVITKASHGVQTIEPLKALTAPVQEVDLGLNASTARPKERA